MAVSLLDVNVLLALAWPNHVNHRAAHRWLDANHPAGWATCPLTQMGFVRLSLQPAVVKLPVLFPDVMRALVGMTQSPDHVFWPVTTGPAGMRSEILGRIAGHHQVTGACLLNLALENEGRLATFDRAISALLPADSELQTGIVVIPT